MKPRKKFTVSALLLSLLASLPFNSANANFESKLTVEVAGFRNNKGQICASLFNTGQGFPNNRNAISKRQCQPITDKSLQITFDQVTNGSYAVGVIHDQNQDQILNRNQLSMPTEGFGFSRNPQVRSRPPKFSDVVFLVVGQNTVIQIQLKYL